MRIGYLVSEYPSVSHTFIRREVNALRERGAEIHTFSVKRPAASELLSPIDRRELAETGYILPVGLLELLRVHAIAAFGRPLAYVSCLRDALRHRLPGMRGAIWSVFHFAEAIRLAGKLESLGIRHLHNHFSNPGATVGFLTARFLGIPRSLTLHGSADFDSPTRPLLGAKIGQASFVACVSYHGRAQALRIADPADWSKVIIARCGLDLTKLPDPLGRKRAPGRCRIICVGRLSPEKGHLGLIDAFADLIDQGVDAELRILGEGPARVDLERQILRRGLGERCSLPGGVPEETVFQEIAASDLFVLPSFVEGLPIVLMEAMALRVPVIAPRLAGIPELVEDAKSGLLFTPTDWEELTGVMMRLIADPEQREQLAAEGRRKVETDFDVARVVGALWERFREVS